MAKKLGLAEARHVVDTILEAATARKLRFAAAAFLRRGTHVAVSQPLLPRL